MISSIAGLSILGAQLALAKASLRQDSVDPRGNGVSSADRVTKPQSVRQTGASTPDNDGDDDLASGAAPVVDTVEISAEALNAARRAETARLATMSPEAKTDMVDRLRKRDREVRAHEAAHQAAGGAYAGSATFSYQTGPDGQQYAVGGEVPIDLSPVPGDPEATIRKMQQIRAAALAPASPSGADRQVAAKAAQIAAEAQAELAQQASSRFGGEGQADAESPEMTAIAAFSAESSPVPRLNIIA